MSKLDKILTRFLSKPKDFTWNELVFLLTHLGFELYRGDGSKRKFINSKGVRINLHEPHPENTVLVCYIKQVIETLKKERLI